MIEDGEDGDKGWFGFSSCMVLCKCEPTQQFSLHELNVYTLMTVNSSSQLNLNIQQFGLSGWSG